MSSPSPVISTVTPSSGTTNGGTAVTIFGQNFQNGCKVRVGGTDSPQVTFISSTQLTAVTPPGTAGPANVRIVNPNQLANVLQNAFLYVVAPPPPVPIISNVTPSSGPLNGGTQVTVVGQNFVQGCQAKFGGTDAQTTFINSSQLNVVTPQGLTAGFVNVRVVNPGQQAVVAQNAFQYLQAPPPPPPAASPIITSVQPPSGTTNGGTQVTIFGQNFVSGCQVKFGGATAQITSFNPNALGVLTPAAQTAGPATVRVINPDPSQPPAVAQNAFTYTQPPPPPPPAAPFITSINPPSGPVAGGTPVTIDGQNFAPGCQVKFEGNIATVTSNTPTRLVAASRRRRTPHRPARPSSF